MEHTLLWLWLTTKYGISSEKITRLLERFGTVEEIYYARSFKGLPDRDIEALMNKDLSAAKKAAERTAELSAKILVYDDEKYPELLKNTPSPPYALYIQGAMPRFDDILAIGVVGTRRSSEYGDRTTNMLCSQLASEGVVTVGGLARGIDTVGAWATLDGGGTAVAVTGCGLDSVYPHENAELVNEITQKGCIITEYPPKSPPLPHHFPRRNRIIAGLTRGTLVTEAPVKSGALITAAYALECGRDVFAVPRDITEEGYQGTNLLIRQGARLVRCAGDIIDEYPYITRLTHNSKEQMPVISARAANMPVRTQKNEKTAMVKRREIDKEKYDKLNDKEKAIIDIIKEKDIQSDEISRTLDMPISEINMTLTLLEMKGLVKKLPGNSYQLKL